MQNSHKIILFISLTSIILMRQIFKFDGLFIEKRRINEIVSPANRAVEQSWATWIDWMNESLRLKLSNKLINLINRIIEWKTEHWSLVYDLWSNREHHEFILKIIRAMEVQMAHRPELWLRLAQAFLNRMPELWLKESDPFISELQRIHSRSMQKFNRLWISWIAPELKNDIQWHVERIWWFKTPESILAELMKTWANWFFVNKDRATWMDCYETTEWMKWYFNSKLQQWETKTSEKNWDTQVMTQEEMQMEIQKRELALVKEVLEAFREYWAKLVMQWKVSLDQLQWWNVSAAQSVIQSFEALARLTMTEWLRKVLWTRAPRDSLVSPFYFLSILETSWLIQELTLQIFEQSCIQAQKTWTCFSFNLSIHEVEAWTTFIDKIDAILKKYWLTSDIVTIEMLETIPKPVLQSNVWLLREMRARWYRLAFDDLALRDLVCEETLSKLEQYDWMSTFDVLWWECEVLKFDRFFTLDIYKNAELLQRVIEFMKRQFDKWKFFVLEWIENTQMLDFFRNALWEHQDILERTEFQWYAFWPPITAEAANEELVIVAKAA